jgi:hypothetical protein
MFTSLTGAAISGNFLITNHHDHIPLSMGPSNCCLYIFLCTVSWLNHTCLILVFNGKIYLP